MTTPETMTATTVHQAMTERRSTRLFNDTQIPRETLEAIASDAQWTPSWANAQPWRLYIATGETLNEIKRNHIRAVQNGVQSKPDLPTLHREDWGQKAMRNMRTWSRGLQSFLGREHGHEYPQSQATLFNAQAIAYVTIQRDSPLWALYDAGAFGHAIMLSAFEHNVDSIPAYETIKYPWDLRESLGIPENELILSGVALGYSAGNKINEFRSVREPLDSMLTIKE